VVYTIAKADNLEEVPGFVEKFEPLSDDGFLMEIKGQGYTHYINLIPGRITVGPIDSEYRVLVAALFFKGEPPHFDEIKEHVPEGEYPVFEILLDDVEYRSREQCCDSRL
jgi:hypothetical protein